MSTVKDDRLQIRINLADEALLERAAAPSHLSVSSFVVQAAALRAEEVLAERSSIRLTPDAAAAFSQALEKPAEVNDWLAARFAAPGSSAGLTELQRLVPLDPGRHRREEFDSAEPALDEWLRRYAGQN